MPPIGPAGLDPFGNGPAAFPCAPPDLVARPGLQGPQVVLAWSAPAQPMSALMIRRKTGEHPRDVEDGVLVRLEVDDAPSVLSVADLAEDLLLADAEPGEGRWWYYRMFVRAAPIPLEDQFAGLAVKLLVPTMAVPAPATVAWDVQGRLPATVYLANEADDPSVARVQTAPEVGGPWVDLEVFNLAAGADATWASADLAPKYLRVVVTGAQTRASLSALWPQPWLTGPSLTQSAYVFKTGRHLRAVVEEGHLEGFYFELDDLGPTRQTFEVEGPQGEVFNLGSDGRSRGFLWQFLNPYLFEFDRVDAYMRATARYGPDYDEMPPQQFAHVAAMLGYPLETDYRNLDDVRFEIARIASFWKSKGTTRLLQALLEQQLGFVPRVQEGAGRLFRVADPDLYGAGDGSDSFGGG